MTIMTLMTRIPHKQLILNMFPLKRDRQPCHQTHSSDLSHQRLAHPKQHLTHPSTPLTLRPPSDIEEMTQKTGNFKKFPVFVKMLNTALSRNSDVVFVDLLTYADLEMLKARKTGKPNKDSSHKNFNKRYVILTYVVEFDRCNPFRPFRAPSSTVFSRTNCCLISLLFCYLKQLSVN